MHLLNARNNIFLIWWSVSPCSDDLECDGGWGGDGGRSDDDDDDDGEDDDDDDGDDMQQYVRKQKGILAILASMKAQFLDSEK